MSNTGSWPTLSGKGQISSNGQLAVARSFCYETGLMTRGTGGASRSALSPERQIPEHGQLPSPSADLADYYSPRIRYGRSTSTDVASRNRCKLPLFDVIHVIMSTPV